MRDIMMNNASKPLDQLKLIDTLLRLILAYHFNTEIKNTSFSSFQDKTCSFKSRLCDDVKAMLSLYEASYYGLEGENIMEETSKFTTGHLNNLDGDLDLILAMQVKHALGIPLH
ncbi:hypothetical protein LWI28_028765 [Acer negundo]|uniref:Terpene synthase N-terminal domain-containing protein n=1 Tax=Acer negundo TaxID=4023 RepID=A0AAD5NYN9_ACENE|nr:hypothetical protein LWI28_028765 [Acer negundo]